MSNKSFSSKTALVTGGASGIGRASAVAFAKAGANVFFLDIDIDGMNAVVREIASIGGKTVAHKTDVTKEHEVIEAIARCVELFGAIDYAHNNAGIVISTTTVACTEDIWQKVTDASAVGGAICVLGVKIATLKTSPQAKILAI